MKRIIIAASLFTMALMISLPAGGAQQGKVIYDSIQSPSLEGNLLKNSSTKPMAIYLPPGYDEDNERYPVAYFLHGYTANHNMWVDKNSIHKRMDILLEQEKVQKIIIVMPNTFNKFGGCSYANSPASGNWEDYLTKDLIEFIDNKYRTLSRRLQKGI
jgi:enterochelin esterase-like enzyme